MMERVRQSVSRREQPHLPHIGRQRPHDVGRSHGLCFLEENLDQLPAESFGSLEVMWIDSVTLSDGEAQGERAQSRPIARRTTLPQTGSSLMRTRLICALSSLWLRPFATYEAQATALTGEEPPPSLPRAMPGEDVLHRPAGTNLPYGSGAVA